MKKELILNIDNWEWSYLHVLLTDKLTEEQTKLADFYSYNFPQDVIDIVNKKIVTIQGILDKLAKI